MVILDSVAGLYRNIDVTDQLQYVLASVSRVCIIVCLLFVNLCVSAVSNVCALVCGLVYRSVHSLQIFLCDEGRRLF